MTVPKQPKRRPSRKFNHDKFTQPVSAMTLIGKWDPVKQRVIPLRKRSWKNVGAADEPETA